jgi:hypothetical protein
VGRAERWQCRTSHWRYTAMYKAAGQWNSLQDESGPLLGADGGGMGAELQETQQQLRGPAVPPLSEGQSSTLPSSTPATDFPYGSRGTGRSSTVRSRLRPWYKKPSLYAALLGAVLFVLLLSLDIKAFGPREYKTQQPAQRCLALLTLVAVLWGTELIPVHITALLIPLLAVVMKVLCVPRHLRDANERDALLVSAPPPPLPSTHTRISGAD